MQEIELSTMYPRNQLALEAFEAASYMRVRYQSFAWLDAWNRIMQVGIYQKGPDVSQVGSTWLENLIEMHALHAFSPTELKTLGGPEAFLPAAWEVVEHGGDRPFSIPWVVDTRQTYYRQDLFEKAGLNSKAPFESPRAFYEALCQLRDAGVRYPLSMATKGLVIHNLASWIWAGGGDFRSAEGNKMLLLEPEARRGIVEYFKLCQFIDPANAMKDTFDSEQFYYAGSAAVLYSGHWVSSALKTTPALMRPAVLEHTGQALPPGGIPYVGGSHLVIWRHSLHESEDMDLIRHLQSPEVLVPLALFGGGFPALRELYQHPAIAGEPLFSGIRESLFRGRPVRSRYRWAAVEVRVNDFIEHLWSDLFTNPGLNIEAEVESRLKILCSRLEKTLLASW